MHLTRTTSTGRPAPRAAERHATAINRPMWPVARSVPQWAGMAVPDLPERGAFRETPMTPEWRILRPSSSTWVRWMDPIPRVARAHVNPHTCAHYAGQRTRNPTAKTRRAPPKQSQSTPPFPGNPNNPKILSYFSFKTVLDKGSLQSPIRRSTAHCNSVAFSRSILRTPQSDDIRRIGRIGPIGQILQKMALHPIFPPIETFFSGRLRR